MTQNLQRFNNEHSPPPELLLQSAIDALPSHVALLDYGGYIVGTNAAWNNFGRGNGYRDPHFGYGLNYIDLCENVHGQDEFEAQRVSNGIRDILNERAALFSMEYPCHSPKARRWFTLQIARFEWEGELRVVTAHQNVTDLKMAQEAFAASQKRLQTILDHVVDGIFTTDEHAIIETVNPAVCDIFGYSAQELIGKSLVLLLNNGHKDHYMRYIRQHRRVNDPRYAEIGHEVQGVRRDGSTFPVYLAMNRAYVNRRWIFTGIVQDLTPRKRIEHEIIERERLQVALEKERELRDLKNRFMSMISHELRTPLSVIMLSSDFMRRYADRMTDAERAEIISTIQTQVRHLENMVDDVSALSRAETLDATPRTESVDIVDLCSDIVATTQMLAAETHRIIFDSHGYGTPILADAKLLRQAISNLLNNAVKYSAPKTTVRLDLTCHPQQIQIKVTDQGIGIPPQDQASLFEPFHRASNVDSRPGTGLGLAVTKRAIELHGGIIEFSSKLNVGTIFVITLPTN